MFTFSLIYGSIATGVVVSFLLGWFYYGFLFKKQWMALTGMTEEKAKKGQMKGMVLGLLSIVLVAFFMAEFIEVFRIETISQGVTVAFWAWLGFVVSNGLMKSAYEQLSMKLLALNMGYQLVSFLVIAVFYIGW